MTDAQQIAERLERAAILAYSTANRVDAPDQPTPNAAARDALLDAGLREAVRICEAVPETVSDPGMIGLAEMILAALKGTKECA